MMISASGLDTEFERSHELVYSGNPTIQPAAQFRLSVRENLLGRTLWICRIGFRSADTNCWFTICSIYPSNSLQSALGKPHFAKVTAERAADSNSFLLLSRRS